MKRVLITAGIVLIVAFIGHAQALVKETKDVVYFKGLGNYEVSRLVNMTDNEKNEFEKTHFKGEGIIKGAIAKMVLKSREQREILQIRENKRFEIDPGKKEYQVFPLISKDTTTTQAMTEGNGAETDTEEAAPQNNQEQESDVEVVRSEFTVTPTDEYKDINGFRCRKYNMLWLTELRNKKTDERTTDSLFTEIWTTPKTDVIEKGDGIENEFNKNYLGSMEIDAAATREMILGTSWVNLFQKTGQQGTMEKPNASNQDAINEMNKIEGTPIVVDGKFFVLSDKKDEQNDGEKEESKEKGVNVKKRLGGFLRRAVEKKNEKPKGPQPAITYHTEVVHWEVTPAQTDWFTVPSDYKLKK
ncbi:MAG TPA: hypothetical protein VKA08_04900 [Balneolales bacterium]|nr:hypothetical protein [Balneolales bacterium]